MKRCLRLTKNFEFMDVYKAKKRRIGPFFNMYTKRNNLQYTRLGVSVSKKVGKSVVRNKVKRRIKEAFRNNFEFIKNGFDIVIKAKPEIVKLDYWEIENELKKMLKKGRLLIDKKNDNGNYNLL
ncbi:MAG TPA: ribonuclease P protein component [Thermoanaerobacterales bacterium]|nr:ribonuclease P protein component [Thermoanaerobacterales bacterium]